MAMKTKAADMSSLDQYWISQGYITKEILTSERDCILQAEIVRSRYKTTASEDNSCCKKLD